MNLTSPARGSSGHLRGATRGPKRASSAAALTILAEPAVRFREVASSVGKVFLNQPASGRPLSTGGSTRHTQSTGSWKGSRVGFDDQISDSTATLHGDDWEFASNLPGRALPSLEDQEDLSQARDPAAITSSSAGFRSSHDAQQWLDKLQAEHRSALETAKEMSRQMQESERDVLQHRRRLEKSHAQAESIRLNAAAIEERMRHVSTELNSVKGGSSGSAAGPNASTGDGQEPEEDIRPAPGALMTSVREVMHYSNRRPSGIRGNLGMTLSQQAAMVHAERLQREARSASKERRRKASIASSVRSGSKKQVSSEYGQTEYGFGDEQPPSTAGQSTRPGVQIDDHPQELVSLEQMAAQEAALQQAQWKEKIRAELIDKANSARGAFRCIDLNGSGNITLQEFADGVKRLGVDWQSITGCKKDREFFNLFAKKGVITFRELFPDQKQEEEQKRLTTPEYWRHYCKITEGKEQLGRGAMWNPHDRDEELQVMEANTRVSDETLAQRKRMSAMWRRLKGRGKSDARCREIVAWHLPRGTGPETMDGVGTFSDSDVKSCKKDYADKINEPVRNIQKVVYDMREKRKELYNYRHRFNGIVEPYNRAAFAEDMHGFGISLGLNKSQAASSQPAEGGSDNVGSGEGMGAGVAAAASLMAGSNAIRRRTTVQM